MELTLEELKAKMAATLTEEAIIDLLSVTSEELVEYLSELIEEEFDKCVAELEQLETAEDE